MKKTIFVLSIIAAIISLAISCKKEANSISTLQPLSREVAMDGNQYASQACITSDSLPGTKCIFAQGKSCSKPGDCVAIKTDSKYTILTSGPITKY